MRYVDGAAELDCARAEKNPSVQPIRATTRRDYAQVVARITFGGNRFSQDIVVRIQATNSISHLLFRPNSIGMTAAPVPPPLQLARITVQPDYPAVLRDIHQVSRSPSIPLRRFTHVDSRCGRVCTRSRTFGSRVIPRRVCMGAYASRRRIIEPFPCSREMEFPSLKYPTSVHRPAPASMRVLTLLRQSELAISCDNLSIPSTPVHFPISTLYTLKGGIDALAISPNGQSFLVGGKDSKVRVGSVSGEKVVELRGHVGDVTSVAWVRPSLVSSGRRTNDLPIVPIKRGSLDGEQ